MTHETRKPMTGILVMTSMINDSDARAGHREFAETVLVTGEGLVGILNDILDFAKIESGRLELESIDFDLRTLVEDVTDLLSVSAHNRNLELACRFPVDMPLTVRGDPGRLRRVVRNLVGNALKFSSSGDVVIELTLAEREDGNLMARFDVVGTHIGSARADQPALFETFARVDAGTIRSYGAAGLGLALSHQLIELMGGDIGVHSELGHGSTFWFSVPLQRAHSVAPLSSAKARAEGSESTDTGALALSATTGPSHRVLLAEDNPVNQKVAAAMLENLGFGVDVVGDGAAAVKAATVTKYQAILMDGQMPVLDGYQATSEIRRLHGKSQGSPIIAVTGSAMKSDQQRCLAAGMDDYLTKPLNLEALDAVLNRWVSASSDPYVAVDPTEPPPAIHVGLDHLDDPARPVLDADVIDRLERLGQAAGEDLVGQLATLFLSDADARVEALREALRRDDAAAAVRSAHTLSGSSANVGATALARLCATLASDSAVGDLGLSEALLDAVEIELGRVRVALRCATAAPC